MFDSFIKEARFQMSERLSSPIWVSFILSWCIWNYKFITVLFSNEPVLKTFEIIDTIIYPDAYHSWGYGLIVPISTCAIYILAYPWVYRKVMVYLKKRERTLTEDLLKEEGITPLSPEKAQRLWDELREVKSEHLRKLQLKDDEIEVLRSQLPSPDSGTSNTSTMEQTPDTLKEDLSVSLNKTIEPAKEEKASKSTTLNIDLPSEELLILQELAKGESRNFVGLQRSIDLPRLILEHSLDELQDKRLIDYMGTGDNGAIYQLNKIGRKYLVETHWKKRPIDS